MDDNLTTGDSGESVCPHCEKNYQESCPCRDSEEEATPVDSVSFHPEANGEAEMSARDSVSPEVRSTPDLQTRATPPPPDVRTVPPVGTDHQLADHSSLPDMRSETPDEPVAGSQLQSPESDKSSEATVDNSVNVPVSVAPSPSPKRTKSPGEPAKANRRPKWGWVLVVGPLLVALAIIAWFQFRVLPPVVENNLPPVDFSDEGIASRPSSPSPDPSSEETPQETQPETPDPVDSVAVETENSPDPELPADSDNPDEGGDEQPDPDGEDDDQGEEPNPENPIQIEPVLVEVDPSVFQQFGTQGFINLFDDISSLPNLDQQDQLSITSSDEADQKLRTIAATAGYVPQPMVADSSQLVGVHRLQPPLSEQWSQLEQAATAAGHSLVITTGYLSAADQTNIFLLQIDDDLSDQALAAAVGQVMVPGYSRHQTGFAIDIVDGNNPEVAFVETEAYGWLSADNFAMAKHFGFVPSYSNVSLHGQAQHQTAFELVYIGRDRLVRLS